MAKKEKNAAPAGEEQEKKKKKEKPKPYLENPLRNMMPNYQVYPLSLSERLSLMLASFFGGGLLGLIFYGGYFKNADGEATILTTISNTFFFVVAGIVAIRIAVPLWSDMKRDKRLQSLSLQFRDFLSSLATALSGGMNVNNALVSAAADLRTQYGEDADIVKEIDEINRGISNNIPVERMFEDLGARSGIQEIRDFSNVFSIGFRTGANLKDVVQRTSEIISERLSVTLEIQTKLTSNKTQMNVMMVVPPVMVLFLKSSSSQFANSFATPIGFVAMTIAICMFVGAYFLGQKVLRIEGA